MNTSLAIIVSFIFFIEVLVAFRIFRKRRKEHQSGATNNQPVIVILNQTHPPTNRSPVNRVAAIQPNRFLQKIISSTPHLKKGKPSRFHQALCLGPIFLITYLGINYMLRPFTFSWILIFFPVLLVIPFLVLPSFFNLKSFATFCCLIGGLGLGGFMLFLLS